MSVSKWAWTWACDYGICIGDCDLCDRPKKLFGKWKKTVDNGTPMLECSACGCRVKRESFMDAVGEKGFNFCPYCGADLREGEDIKPRFGKWIPVSVRLPKLSFSYSSDCGYDCYESEFVLVTTDYDCVQIANLSSEVVTDKKRYEEICGGEPGDPVWFSRDKEEDDVIPVIAWMPLPEPYGGES